MNCYLETKLNVAHARLKKCHNVVNEDECTYRTIKSLFDAYSVKDAAERMKKKQLAKKS